MGYNPTASELALSWERLREALHYEPETGIFTNIIRRGRRIRPNTIAGCLTGIGRVVIRIDGINYLAHRLAWFYMTGRWVEQIDHRDLDQANNRFSNLRECTGAQNRCNVRVRKHNKCGLKGVQAHQGRFRARISSGGKIVRREMFDTAQEAHEVYCRWAIEIHGEFARAA